MPAVLNEQQQWVDTAGKPLVNGKAYFGDVGADPLTSPQDIFADREFTIPLAQPQLLDGFGRTANKVWIKGRYSIQIDDLNNVQQYLELDNGDPENVGLITLENVQGATDITATGVPTVTSYIDKAVYILKSVSANGTPVTLDIDNVGPKPVTYPNAEQINVNQWDADQNIIVTYNETSDSFIWGQVNVIGQAEAEAGINSVPKLVSALSMAQSIASLATLPRSYLAGLELSKGSDAEHDVDIQDGEARDDANTEDMVLPTVLTKQIDAPWAVGDNQGGLDTGTVAADTWYHVHLIKRTDTGVVDALFSLSPTAPSFPPGYDKSRRIRSRLTDASENIIGSTQDGDDELWDEPPLDVSTAVQGATSISYVVSSPDGVKCNVKFAARMISSTAIIYIRSLDQTDEVVPASTSVTVAGARPWTLNRDGTGGSSPGQSVEKILRTDLNSQIAARSDKAAQDLEILTIGYTDRRGRDG